MILFGLTRLGLTPVSNYLGFDTVPLRSVFSQAIRFNGYSDGIVVPTGAYKESGTKLGPTDLGNSNATKIGHLHFPNEGNPLNNMIGPFTLEAFVIPDFGGVIIEKPNCYSLKIGEVASTGPITFDLHTLDPSGSVVAQRVSSKTQYPTPPKIYGEDVNLNTFERYTNGEYKPQDVLRSSRELIYICAQFTGKAMRIYANGDLVGDIDFGGEDRVVRSYSSDLYIGGKGGEYRGVIESVRINRGIIEPKIQPFTVSQDTIGLWNFEDVVDVPDLYFPSGQSRVHDNVGSDGVGKDGMLDIPMVCIGYDFVNIVANNDLTLPNHPFTATSGNDYSIFRIREAVGGLGATPYEKLAAYILNIPVSELKHQSWWEGGYLDLTTLGSGTYDANMKITNLNAIINQSGTHPLTGLPRTPRSLEVVQEQSTLTNNENIFGGLSLDPMHNPIERIRILGIDFNGYGALGAYDPNLPVGAWASATTYNRPPCIVATGNHIKDGATPLLSCFKYFHSDDTPVWFTLGNTDLVVDGGWSGSPYRTKDALTRYHFTQGQMFRDATNNKNDGYFVSPYSRMSNVAYQPITINNLENPTPYTETLALHYDANVLASLLKDDGLPTNTDGDYIFWWKNIAPQTATVPNATDASAENYALYGWGDGWRLKRVCANAKGRAGLVAENPVLYNPVGPSNYPGGIPPTVPNVITPTYPAGQFYWGGSSWVNGLGSGVGQKKVNMVLATIEPQPIFIDGAGAPLISLPNGHLLNSGDWSFYLVMTPQYGSSGTRLDLIHSQANNELNVGLNVPNQPHINVAGVVGFPLGNNVQPDAGYPAVVSLRIDESADTYTWIMARNGEYEVVTNNSFTTTAPIMFDDVSASMQLSGIEFFGSMLATSPTASTLLNLAPPGFIVHEILVYADHKTDAEDREIRQYIEDKYGVGA